ncbi:arsenate reductase (glutaredoxin) [Ramlibacter sp.]|uniref:arsenate reductase (glutaredoxin) n=1 Tax=Ramlibacter sp. TaxID=1917967 RepID=UPI002D5F7FEA|nr:arsenate reductase (glutaredoxin) [Ramlibacter sp.]HYD77593.1 arsenate reductase (glutaredoxin) [Ramlibacter sp.]
MSDVTIYHNPACSTSRNTLALLREHGVQPQVVEYLKTPPARDELQRLVAQMGIPVRGLLRNKEAVYGELGLDDPKWTDDQLVDFMLQHPILIQRPIVATTQGVRLGRPPEAVLEILPGTSGQRT